MRTEVSSEHIRSRLLALLQELRGILESEGGRNWLPGINGAIDVLQRQPASPGELDDELRAAASIYRSMHRGPGSFGDFYIQRPDPEEQARANEHYGKIADELWFTLEPIR